MLNRTNCQYRNRIMDLRRIKMTQQNTQATPAKQVQKRYQQDLKKYQQQIAKSNKVAGRNCAA